MPALTCYLDLNGYTLDLEVGTSHALYIHSGGKLLLVDPTNGAFNVYAETLDYPSIYVIDTGSRLEVTNVTYAGNSAMGAIFVYGHATGFSEVTVYGNITNESTHSDSYAIWTQGGIISVKGDVTATHGIAVLVTTPEGRYGGEVIIDGVINVGVSNRYIRFGADNYITQGQSISPTTRAGYDTYSDGMNSVWVRAQ